MSSVYRGFCEPDNDYDTRDEVTCRLIVGYVPVRLRDGKVGSSIPWLDSYEEAAILAWRLSVRDGEPREVVPICLVVDESALGIRFQKGLSELEAAYGVDDSSN